MKNLEPLGCTYEMANHLDRFSSMFDEKPSSYGIEEIGLPEGVDVKEFDLCVENLLKIRNSFTNKEVK